MSLPVKTGAFAAQGWWSALGALALGLLPVGARAEQWTLENSLVSRFESNDNVALAQTSPGTMNTLSLSTALNAARRTENSATRVNAGVTSLRQWGPGEQDRVDGRLGLGQSLSDPLNSYTGEFQVLQDFNNATGTADVAVPRGRRRSKTLSGGWTRSLTERTSSNAQIDMERTGYGQDVPGAVNYRNASVSGGVSHRWTDVGSLSVSLSHSEYRTEADTNRSATDQINVSLSRAVSERSSGSLSFGTYRTKTQTPRAIAVCPLAISECLAGNVPFTVGLARAYTTDHGLQYSLSQRYQFDETTELAFSAGRQQAPSGAGFVVRSDTLKASANHGFSPTLNGGMSYAQSRSTYQGTDTAVARPAQQTFSMSLSKQLSPDLSLDASYQFSHAEGVLAGQGARSNSFAISLQFAWPKLDAAR